MTRRIYFRACVMATALAGGGVPETSLVDAIKAGDVAAMRVLRGGYPP